MVLTMLYTRSVRSATFCHVYILRTHSCASNASTALPFRLSSIADDNASVNAAIKFHLIHV